MDAFPTLSLRSVVQHGMACQECLVWAAPHFHVRNHILCTDQLLCHWCYMAWIGGCIDVNCPLCT